jgi:hypothetical protein
VPVATTSHRDDLQAGSGSLPVENSYGNHVDTLIINAAYQRKSCPGLC